MLIPENCPFMKTYLLNPEIHNKVNDSATSRDKGAQGKQRRLLFKPIIPPVKAIVALKELEHDTHDKIPRFIKRMLQDPSPLLHKNLRANNTVFNEIERQKKK